MSTRYLPEDDRLWWWPVGCSEHRRCVGFAGVLSQFVAPRSLAFIGDLWRDRRQNPTSRVCVRPGIMWITLPVRVTHCKPVAGPSDYAMRNCRLIGPKMGQLASQYDTK